MHNKQIEQAKTKLKAAEQKLTAELNAHKLPSDVSTFRVTEETPEAVSQAYKQYQITLAGLATLEGNPPSESVFVRWTYEFLPILAVIVVVRSFIIEPFNIPSSSMVPTLHTGDFVVVNKSAYGLRLPLLHTKILDTGSPERGDVVVFRYPLNEKQYYIKRVIGLPGDKVSFDNGVLSINGEAITTAPSDYKMPAELLNFLAPSVEYNPQTAQETAISPERRAELGRLEEPFARYAQETLGEHKYNVRYLRTESETGSWSTVVPPNQYFMMGDNRDNSKDSRFWGFVPEENLSGKATYIWMYKAPGLNLPKFTHNGAID